MEDLLRQVRACRLCEGLPLGPNPILQASAKARILIAGQAPGRITHGKGRPFDDPSGERLRQWLGVSRAQFYDPGLFAIIPMGFCFPGTGKGGDLPPRPLCAETWRAALLGSLTELKLTLVIGQYAMAWHRPAAQGPLTVQVRQQDLESGVVALPHPSPRNLRWLKANPWFAAEILPQLRVKVSAALAGVSPPIG